ncbi:MAG: hypothetical protein ABIP97_13600 [Chthoniobacterales bacterium]
MKILITHWLRHLLLFCLLGNAVALAVPVDVKHAPSPAIKQALIQGSWEESKEAISAALIQAYIPSRFTLAQSSQDVNFVAWLNLWQWFDLFSQTQGKFFEHYLRQHIAFDKDDKLSVFGSGIEITSDYRLLTDEEWLKISENISSVAKEKFGVDTSRASDSVGDLVGKDFAKVLIGNDAFSRQFFQTLSSRDNVPAVLENLKDIWQNRPKQFESYENLALALAVVFDQLPPSYWPHSQVNPKAIPRENITLLERFDFWVASNESRHTLIDFRKLNALQLKFVVDALVSRAELEWGQKNVRFPIADFGKAFTSIQYDQSRIYQRQFQWPGPEYTLAAIRQHGGICVDQAYFAMLSGKALGVPTLFFTGQGRDGGHAWLGYMKSDGRWDMDCGRYINQNFVAGEALDPQTWLPISDHELSYLAARFRDTPAFLAASNELVMAKLAEKAGDTKLEAKILDGAVTLCPAYVEAWQTKTRFLHQNGGDPKVMKDHLEAALRQFTNNEDVRTFYQKELAALARSQGDENTATMYEAKIMQQNLSRRSDISVTAGAGKLPKLKALIKDKKIDEAYTQYNSLLLQLGPQGGGNFYYEVVRPFVIALIEAGDMRSAKRAIEAAVRTLRPDEGTILWQDLYGLEARTKPTPGKK